MAAQCDPLSGYLPQPLSDPGSNSERSADSPAPGSEEDSAGPPRPLHGPEWGEERFRVDRKKLEAMLQVCACNKSMAVEYTRLCFMGEEEEEPLTSSVLHPPSSVMDRDRLEHIQHLCTWYPDLGLLLFVNWLWFWFYSLSSPESGIMLLDYKRYHEIAECAMSPQPQQTWMCALIMSVNYDYSKEHQLPAAAEGKGKSGEDFFQKIMEETNTQIAWPSKLKIGAKSKKDPHIKVSGKKENVKEAKEKIMSVLDTKSNRVTLKMDVSHTEHSHVIGKGGNNIKKVMEETGCHIHFPDSNRNNQAEKSNQVSIAGQPAGVESARVRIRELLPLVLMFELPIAGILQPIPDPNSPTIQHVCQTYNISVSFKQRSRMYGATVIVRGSQNNTSAVKEGTAMLLEHLAGSLASAIPVSTQLDIAAQHHLFMMGRNGSNIKHIMQRTGAQIHFPDPSNPQKKSTVYLQGTIESVCLARQYLMGCLPLVLMFDMKEEIEVEPQFITQLMEQLDVFISIKPKPKQPSKSVIVKSVERNALNMYEARKCLLGLESSGVTVVSNPSTVSCPVGLSCPGLDILSSAGLGLTGLGLLGPTALSVNTSTAPNSLLNALNSSVSPLQSPSSGTPSPTLWATSLANTNTTGFSAIPHLMIPSTAQATLTSILLSGVPNYGQNTPSPPPGLTPVEVHVNGMQSESKRGSPSLNGHVKAFDYEQKKLLATKAMLKKPVVTEVRTPTNTWSGLGFSKSMPAETIKELRRANHVSYKPSMTTTYEGSSMSLSRSSSREHLGSGSESDNWRDRNGLGPAAHDFVSSIGSPKRKQNKSAEHYLSSSNYMDCISSLTGSNGCNLNSLFKGSDLPELFSKLGLGKYTDVFQQQEVGVPSRDTFVLIDLQTFLTLTDQDLKELGITTFGARRKMLLAISGSYLKRLFQDQVTW
ncbi:hypothetical protein DUI87_11865 [Hirundo rustica rustica]|uniref:SAM domain-containing protein n=1 Tax=Hirundo rustica rustica TaxID=333673 RepID=A0A3M0KGM3_HIRRU|nr:hypothetical protein DUI87_11865 [Hirundo rustica rustica]